jgi:hypothetical protein
MTILKLFNRPAMTPVAYRGERQDECGWRVSSV